MPHRQFAIGIVGAGLAGCCAAYFVRNTFPDDTRIIVYERERDIGGRIRSVSFAGLPVELGATFIHSNNRTVADLLRALSLDTKAAEGRDIAKRITVGIWNGRRFGLTFAGSGPVTLARLAFRYGMSLVRLRQAVVSVLARWDQVYELQSTHRTFQDPRELLRTVGLSELADETMRNFLHKYHMSPQVRAEISDPICRAIFNQGGNINAFAGMIALAGGGVGGGDVLSIRGGNYRLCEELLKAARAQVMTRREVNSIQHNRPSGFAITDRSGRQTFDAVIIAAPLETARIVVSNNAIPKIPFVARNWQTAHVTCVAGRLSPAAFGLSSSATLPDIILTTETTGVPFSVINPIGQSPTSQDVYKIQSQEELGDRMCGHFFERIDSILHTRWAAYPLLGPPVPQTSFAIDTGLYYVNCMESFASTLETEAVASKNVVELMRRDILQ
jgi:prenylcysteine oxidase / farnesylcysteine lyase